MANQRYFITCPVCRDKIYMGKSIGNGIYNMSPYNGVYKPGEAFKPKVDPDTAYAKFLEDCYSWMWTHMMECYKDETKDGILFTINSDE